MVANKLDARRLVFMDEMGTNTSLAPIYAWAPKGRRAYSKAPRNRGPNMTLLASMTTEGEDRALPTGRTIAYLSRGGGTRTRTVRILSRVGPVVVRIVVTTHEM